MDNNNKSFLSFSFSKGFISPNLPIATFYQGDKELNFIIDTGSDDNVINRDSLNGIEYEPVKHKGTLAGIGGVYDVQACNIKFSLGDDSFNEKFLIADHLKDAFDGIKRAHCIMLHGMLGSNFLRNNNIVLDFKKLEAYSK